MQEVMLKTHLIVTDVHEEYFVDWCGKIANTKPIPINTIEVLVFITAEKTKTGTNKRYFQQILL